VWNVCLTQADRNIPLGYFLEFNICFLIYIRIITFFLNTCSYLMSLRVCKGHVYIYVLKHMCLKQTLNTITYMLLGAVLYLHRISVS